jgi:hypothetical protein
LKIDSHMDLISAFSRRSCHLPCRRERSSGDRGIPWPA